ncbi:MAG: threonine/serine exporter family protein, partial [Gordonia sp. (in: high G+C Gram-positive bacteria)]
PLLPGLAMYRGLYGVMSQQTIAGFRELATAITIGCSIAAGVTLGEFIARKLKRPHLPVSLVRGRATGTDAKYLGLTLPRRKPGRWNT